MSTPLTKEGQVVDLLPHCVGHNASQKVLVAKTDDMEIVQLIIPAGADVPTYEAQGELILHCLQGRLTVSALAVHHDLRAGQLLYLSTNEPFSVQGIEDASLLVTIITAKQGGSVDVIGD